MYRLTALIRDSIKYQGYKRIIVRTQSSSVQNKPEEKENKSATEESTRFQEVKVSARIQEKLPPREPLVKNFFIGRVDKELVPFPEVISREDLSKLQDDIRTVRENFENLDASKIDSTQCIEKGVRDELKQLGLYGHNIHQNYGGSGYSCSEHLIAAEPARVSADIANILSSHSIAADLLQEFGSDYQKEQILPKLANGEIVATVAIFEASSPEEGFFTTKAYYEDVDKHWVLNGEKTFVVDGKTADMYLVLAQTRSLNVAGDIAPGISLFLVDASSPGVKCDKPVFTLGCRASGYSTVQFENVNIQENSVLGQINGGNDIAQHLLQYSRLRMSLVNLGLIKNVIKSMTEHSIEEKQGPVFLRDLDIVGEKLSRLVCKAYALESMIYYTAGLIDEFDNPDIAMEVAVTKLYSLNALWKAASTPIDFMGPQSLLSNCATEAVLRNAAQLYVKDESKDSLSLYVGLLGLQHTGINTHETIRKERNPLLHPSYLFGKFIRQESIDSPKLRWNINEELHPTLDIPSKCLEYSIARLQMAAEALLVRYGTEVIEKQIDIRRMAEMASLIYAMFTSLSRASRSYCIGLKYSDYEILLASSVCYHAHERVKTLALEISNGPYVNNDINHIKIAKQIFRSRGYFPEHPTTYNF